VFLDETSFTRCEVSLSDAVAYLRGEAIHLADVPLGIVLLTCKNEPIGFVKNIGNRANNLYPNEWRIRSGYLPGALPDFLRPSK
jgi:NOL1/NOP2/fmu family ribosome biogenesis protein